jgi:two-component system response regulator HydG
MTSYPSYGTALEAMDAGAYDYLNKPIDSTSSARRCARPSRSKLFSSNVSSAPARQALRLRGHHRRQRAHAGVFTSSARSRVDGDRLILGETGTGRLVARAIHNNSPPGEPLHGSELRRLSETILERALQHEKGAFTGAMQARKDASSAHGGTLFSTRSATSPPRPGSLLRVIVYGEVFRVGSNEPFKVDVRLIAATHKDLEA